MPWDSIEEIARQVNSGEIKAAELVERSLACIQSKQEYQAIISNVSERARQRASEIDQKVANGEAAGRLAGVPYIAKDNFLTFGSETTAASNMLKGFNAPYQASAIQKLEAEGAICVAKANMDAFGHGGSTENSDFFTTKNPHDTSRVPGGSSGGPAAAVVLDMAPFAIATDTGGSIRQPASFTGSVGLRPSYGLVSRSGVVAMASSTDTISPLTKTVQDTSLILDVIAGRDPLDSTTIDRDPAGYLIASSEAASPSLNLSTVKIGLIKEYMGEGVDPNVRQKILGVVDQLKARSVDVREVSLPSLDLALAAYYIIAPAEISSNLSRYDGQRFGYSAKEALDLDESYVLSRSQGFGAEAKRRIMVGTYVLSSGYYDAYYRKAQQLRTKLIEEFEHAFKSCDFLIGPVAPTTAFKIGENASDPLSMYLADIMTVAVSLAGIPAISVPAGKSNGLPVGVQLMAPARNDRQLLQLAKEVEALNI